MTKEYPHGDGIVKWVDTQWLMDHATDEDLMILDAQPNVHDYIKAHIPGAIYMNEGLLRVPKNGLPAQYVPEAAIEAIFRRVGLEADRPLVVYTGKGLFSGWGNGLEQTMVAYTLARFGHKHVYVLDGGFEQWMQDEGPVSQVFPEVTDSNFGVEVQREYFVAYDAFRALKDREDVILLDARPPDVYEGQGPWIKPGHIPGAVNVPWKVFMTDENPRKLRPDDEIQAILDEHEITPEKTVICSCGTGREATNEFLLFKWYLGFPKVKIYEGSFTEWSSYPENPTVTGPNPR
ncbi:MAG: sulfurtransferase [Chloroflexi bacterium]|jgi:thiosulfate/3-mercaptopyruvate sulfurtransferase|nr:sulfurtransferase [Chloroflexota bacterium]